jgi:hypothetical protein
MTRALAVMMVRPTANGGNAVAIPATGGRDA